MPDRQRIGFILKIQKVLLSYSFYFMTIGMKTIEIEKPAQTIRKAFLEKRLRLSDELGLSIYACHQWQRVPAQHHYQVLKIAKRTISVYLLPSLH